MYPLYIRYSRIANAQDLPGSEIVPKDIIPQSAGPARLHADDTASRFGTANLVTDGSDIRLFG
ncbi:MAG: hypothetical protein ACREBG_29650 [Pyrinomonadaceae bacterium]